MTTTTDTPITEWVSRSEAAAYLGGLNPKTLSQWAWLRQGPPFARFGSQVRYRRSDLDAWAQQQIVAGGAA